MKQEQIQVFYSRQIGSSDGSILSSKEFHVCYHILKHDMTACLKRIIGIIYNKFDNQWLYFQTYCPLSEDFNLEWLLRNVIYSREKKYNNNVIREVLLGDSQKKHILNICQSTIREKISS